MDDDNQQRWVAEVGDREEYEHRGALHYMQRMRSDVDRLLEKWEAERPRLIALQQQLAAEKAVKHEDMKNEISGKDDIGF